MSDIFKIQDEIAAKVAQQLKITLLGDIASTPVNPEAYNLYLQAKQLTLQRTVDADKNAETLIRRSIALDENYPPAWALLGGIKFAQIYNFATIPMTQENIEMGMDAAMTAISLDPQYAGGYAVLVGFQRANWDFKVATSNIQKALDLAPEDPEVIRQASKAMSDLGKLEEGIRLQLKVLELDPLNHFHYFNLGLSYYLVKDNEKAEKSLQNFLLHYPGAGIVHSLMALVHLAQGEKDKALEELDKEPDPFWRLYNKTMVVYAIGDKKEADALLSQLIKEWGDLAWPNIASVYAFRGEKDEAFRWLDLAYENKDGSMLEILSYPEMENLWGDPRWNAFINKLGLPKDHGFHLD